MLVEDSRNVYLLGLILSVFYVHLDCNICKDQHFSVRVSGHLTEILPVLIFVCWIIICTRLFFCLENICLFFCNILNIFVINSAVMSYYWMH